MFLDWLFEREEINGHGRCSTYLYRWIVMSTRWLGVYIHRFVADDWSRDLHDHPKRFVSIGLSGGYTEETPRGFRHYAAPWIRTFPAEHIHRVALGKHHECWTLVIVFRASRQWGFWHNGEFLHWKEYVKGRFAHVADKMKACADV